MSETSNKIITDLTNKNTFIDLSSNVSGSVNLNAGLPWTNPLKLTIGSDEHILDTTINRGLMMLLNNDYYLDMKESLMAQELSTIISNTNLLKDVLISHIKDSEQHGIDGITIENKYTTTIISRRIWII